MTLKIIRKNPNAIQKVYDRLQAATKKVVAVGFPTGKCQAYPNGMSVAAVAAFHVYGIGVPRRDFMAAAMPGIKKNAMPIIKKIAKLETDREAMFLYSAAGEEGKKAIQQAIEDFKIPGNAPSTIAKKGVDNPLQDTDHMLQSVTYVVRDK